jgi:hypothetical protein
MTLYDTKLHKIWLVPLDIIGAGLGAGAVAGAVTGFANLSSFKDYLINPLVFVRSMGGNLSARNRDLNPIGLKRNIRQHFGSNSNKVTLDCYISPMEHSFSGFSTTLQDTIAIDKTTAKFLYLKNAIHDQTNFLLLYNNDFEVVTLDVLDYKENAKKPYIYDLLLQATSIRSYDGWNKYLFNLSKDIAINTIAQNLLPTMVI